MNRNRVFVVFALLTLGVGCESKVPKDGLSGAPNEGPSARVKAQLASEADGGLSGSTDTGNTFTETVTATTTETGTETGTLTQTATSTATATHTDVGTVTQTTTATVTSTVTLTTTGTQTLTSTQTTTSTGTSTATQTLTSTRTTTATQTATGTQSATATRTATVTQTRSATSTKTGTTTRTQTSTAVQSETYHYYPVSATVTATDTAVSYYSSWTRTGVATATNNRTATTSTTNIIIGTKCTVATNTVTNPFNGTETKTVTGSVTASGSLTGTPTQTLTLTATATYPATGTGTHTYGGSGTKTITATGSNTGNGTQSWTYHPTATVTNTVTSTVTSTLTGTATITNTITNTTTVTTTGTSTGTSTFTSTSSSTSTYTFTSSNTATSTNTVANTSTQTQTATSSSTSTGTQSVTKTDTSTATGTDTATVTNTVTNTVTVTLTVTSTATGTSIDGGVVVGVDAGGYDTGASSPAVSLDISGNLFTSAGTLTLTANATDDVALTQVVFSQDGAPIGTVTTAPYTFELPVTSALNGRRRYTAMVSDVTGNTATSAAKRVLIAIDNKFFGTAATTAADYTNLLAHFNQVTPGNAGKWGSVEAVRGTMNWTDLDTAYNFAKANNLPFKLHTLVWGSQQPAWIDSLPADQQLAAIDTWMSALAARYPNIDLIDVVNEPLHTQPSYVGALGGAGATGWDWVVKAFEMARAHFPNAELLLNEYFVLPRADFTASYVAVINVLKDRGLIDGIGEQGHFYERAPELSVLTANLATLAATGLPIYISELDINFADDARQAVRMSELFPIFWSNPSVLGITHWGYLPGTWQPNAYLIRGDGTLRPALTWIECYRAGGTDCTVPVYTPTPRTGDVNGITLEAEDYDSAHDLLPAGNVVAYANDGSWLDFNQVAFNSNWDTLSVTYAEGGSNTINLTVYLDSLATTPVATIALTPTGGWSTMKTVSIPWAPISTQKDVFFLFNGGGANLDKMQFSAPAGTGPNLLADSDFEQGTIGGWSSWVTGPTIANTTARAVSGTHGLAMTARTGNAPLAQWLTSTVLPGKTYKVSVWATIGGVTSDTAEVTTAIQCSTDSSATYGRLGGWSNSQTITDGTWVNFSGDLVVPDCALTQVQIWLEGPQTADLYIDHVSVRQQTSSNIIANGTFESGTSGWYTWGGGTLSATTARAHGGLQSLLVSGRTSNSPAATDLTSVVKAGTNYPFSLWVAVNNAAGSSQAIDVNQSTSCKAADGTVTTTYGWIANPVTVPTTGWVQLSGTVAVPSASTCTLTQLQIFVEGGAGSDLYVDDVQVIDNSGPAANLIPDGTFESGQGAWGGWNEASVAVTATAAHSGLQSLLGSTMNNGALSRDIKALVTAGKRYQATAWVSVGNLATGSGSVGLQTVQNCNADASDSYPWLAGVTVANGAWVQVTGTVDLTGCTTVNKLLLFLGAASGDLYVDDVALTALP